MTEIIPFTPDYSTNRSAALELVAKIKDYYYKRGVYNFDVWLEKRNVYSGEGEILNTFFDIRSNLKFKI